MPRRLKSCFTLPAFALLAVGTPITARATSELDWLAVRALVDELPAAVVQRVAHEARGTWYTEADNPEAAKRSLRQHIEHICGSVQPGYMELLPTLVRGDLDELLGQRVYEAEWPACLRVQRLQNFTRHVQAGDNLGSIKRHFTGDGISNIDSYFAANGLTETDSISLPVGLPITIPFFTATTRLEPKSGTLRDLEVRLNEVGRTVLAVGIEREPVGEIIGPTNDEPVVGQTANSLADCNEGDGSVAYPFDGAEVVEAFSHLTGGRRDLSVAIIDNGFFGAPCIYDGQCPDMTVVSPEAERRFPRAIFHDAKGGWGPPLGNYWPLNYSNEVQPGRRYGYGDADAVSGHGTHVAGLVLGGTVLSSDQRELFYNETRPWLRIVSGNLSGGRRNIPAGMETDMLTVLAARDDILVANLSVSFSKANSNELEKAIRDLFLDHHDVLFVVASGNGGKQIRPLGAMGYPAAFGGRIGNIVTVTSVDGPVGGVHRLSRFSNYGESYVDIAAPGCKLESWLDTERHAVRLSGTSQAAPVVTFAATLLRSVWSTKPSNIRQRLMVSGDLLALEEDRDRVRSRSQLNIAKSLTYPWDRVTFERDGVRRTFLGALRAQLQGVVCKGGDPPSAEIRAYKRLRKEDPLTVIATTDLELDTCEAEVRPGRTIRFDAEYEIDPNGRFMPPAPLDRPIDSEELIELIRAF